MFEFKNLESKGFFIIRSFLSYDEIKILSDDFQSSSSTGNENYEVRPVRGCALKKIKNKLESLCQLICSETSISADIITEGGYFSTLVNKPFDWHQDHESYYLYQDHYNYLNCYMPIIKPRKDKSNLSIIPLNNIENKSPDFFEKIICRGSSRARYQDSNTTVVFDDDSGAILHLLNYDINELAFTPELEAGDLLLLRGDVFHKTQDNETKRAALSVRILNSKSVVSKKKFICGGKYKMRMMIKNYHIYDKALNFYKMCKQDEASVGELYQYLSDNPVPKSKTWYEFFKILVKQKWRTNAWSNWYD